MKNLEFKGTVGEWRLNKNMEVDSSYRAVYRLSTDQELTTEEYSANKQLFEASRDLLNELQRARMALLEHGFTEKSSTIISIDKAIEKALK